MPTRTASPRDLVAAGAAIVLPNREWVDERVNLISLDGDLEPGEVETVVRYESTDGEYPIAVKGVGATRHIGTLTDAESDESLVEYEYQFKRNPADEWANLRGISSPLPWGTINEPRDIIEGSYVGPVASFRIRIRNRTEGEVGETAIPEDTLGGIATGLVMDGEEEGITNGE